jgi:glycosyltransferase involved in cell wall biosynthesis
MPFEQPVEPSSNGAVRQRIGINAHLLSAEASYRRAGIHQYIIQTLRHLPREEDGPQRLLYTRQSTEVIAHSPHLMVFRSRWPTEHRLIRLAWEQLAWPLLARRHGLNLLHGMAFVTPVLSPCPTVVTVYDLSFVHFPDRFAPMQRLYLSSQTRRSCQRAKRVITISDSGRQDVHQRYAVPLEQIDVVRPGVDEGFEPRPAGEVETFRHRHGLTGRIILHIGTLQPRKNIPVLLEAFKRIVRPDLLLVLVGAKGWLFEGIFRQVESLGLKDSVRFTGYVPDEELPLWYNAASLFVFPSLHEGFGMPVVESMACGTPVIASNRPSISEAAGEAAMLFNPFEAGALADRMEAVLNDDGLRAKMREAGLAQASRFSWQRAGRETAAVYRRALAAG